MVDVPQKIEGKTDRERKGFEENESIPKIP